MYLWALLITAAIGLVAGLLAIAAGESLRRSHGRQSRGRWSAGGLEWACLGSGAIGTLLLVGGFLAPQLRGRTPPREGVEFTPTPFTDPLVISSGLCAFALVVGWYLVVRGDRSWQARAGLGTGAVVAAVWLFYLTGRLLG